MELKKVDKQAQLLQARNESLEAAEKMSLRPLGKLWGMDVFTWCKPAVTELAATISTFPFPVFWLSNEEIIQEMARTDPDMLRSVQWCAQFDNPQLSIPSEIISAIPLVTGTESLEDVLEFLKKNKKARHILLFTVQGAEWKTKMEIFENFVRLHQ
ncbi:hypothetical protein [Fluviicola sp.]|jgi:hypothetical protein|uniref:hypothetical protein n=1 Tax=Fluviicola sp. TaxID=1917219 RepID=UPI002839B64E|nr:hypothetical protein [Fluviicola sp.]MDR0801643.1 hypothetical protein [Fluviicola sp.]